MTKPNKRTGRWKAGESGNPAGRPKGILDRRSAWRNQLGDALPVIVEKLVESAKAGDVAAASLILARVAPPLRPVREPVVLPALGEAESLGARARAVLAAVAAGELSTDAASELLAAIGALGKIIETDELAARIAALEADREP